MRGSTERAVTPISPTRSPSRRSSPSSGMTPTTLAAALLHDTVEDTSHALDQMRREFGDEIAGLVDGVTKLDKMTHGEAAQAETVRKMVVAMARDIRVPVIAGRPAPQRPHLAACAERVGQPQGPRPSTSTPRWPTGSA